MKIQKLLRNTWPEWELVREIGAGSQGTVYMIRRRDGGEDPDPYAALKVLDVSAELSEGGRKTGAFYALERIRDILNHPDKLYGTGYGRILRADILRQTLNHPNLVQLQDWTVAEASGKAFLLMRMELLLPLDAYDGADPVKVGTEICSALAQLHSCGIFHLDVKPGNIFVSRDGVFKLGDFGSARNLYDLSKGDFPAGTLHYAAPEALSTRSVRSTAEDAARADLYSLGMVLFELLMWEDYGRDCHGPGDEPNDREEWFHLQRGYETEVLYGDDSRPLGLRDVVRKALSVPPFLRYESAEEMREAILNTVEAEMRESGVNRTEENSAEASLDAMIREDVRGVLLLKYQSGVHRRFTGYPYVGVLSGLRLTAVGHEPPKRILINDAEILFKPTKDGFIDLSLMEIYRDSTWPMHLDLVAQYPKGQRFEWQLIQGIPDRGREWFKRPDWT